MRKELILLCLSAAPAIAYGQEPADTTSIYDDLEELVITAKKEVIKSDGAKLTYDLEQDDTSKGKTLLDALRKVPMVTVDGQDQIYIKGDGNFKIYVNGKEDPMLTANYKTVFKSMPAESVARIEVITEPGAKYDAEGTAGILNLVTERKQTKEGYTGSASLSGSTQNIAASLYGRMRYDKVTADANVNYANNHLQGQHQFNHIEIINHRATKGYRQVSDMDQNLSFDFLGAGVNLSWEPTENDLFSFGSNVNWITAGINKLDTRINMFSRDGTLEWSTLQKIGGTMKKLGSSGNLSYRRTLGRDGHYLTGAYRFNFGKNIFDLDYENSVEYGEYAVVPFERNRNHTYQREHTATIDYTNSIQDGKHVFEAGGKGVFRRNSALTYHAAGSAPDAMQSIGDDTGGIRQIQDVYAGYITYTGTFGKTVATGGLRYEHTYMGLDFISHSQPDFRRHLNDIVPNAAVTYMFSPASNLRAAYQMRISRPSAEQMNPTMFRLTQNYAKIGNPDLESERYNSVSLTYSNFGPVLGGNISVSYSQANNAIEEYTYLENEVATETYGNFGKNRRTEVTAFLNWNINRKMAVSVNGSVNYTDIRAGKENLHNSGWNGNYGLNWNYTGPWNMKYSVYGGHSTGAVQLQGGFGGWHYYGLSVKKSFLKEDALSVTLNAGNFLTKYTYFKSWTNTPEFSTKGRHKNRQWNVGLTISWNFGHLQDQVKKTDANLENNDTKTTGGKSGGIGL